VPTLACPIRSMSLVWTLVCVITPKNPLGVAA
jgi:hypothetical protein